MARWGIVGGGMLGMTLALRLAQSGEPVELFESESAVGGLAGAWMIGDQPWDRHYHVTLLSDRRLRALLAELGLASEIEWKQSRTAFYTGGRLSSMSNAIEFLKFPPLRLIDKLRLGATILHASRLRDWRPLEKIRAVDWLRSWSGERTTERIWIPLLRAKLGDNYERVSAAFIWATIARMYGARRSGMKREMFGYVRGGYARVLPAMAQLLEKSGVIIHRNAKVQSVRKGSDGKIAVALENGPAMVFDQAVITLPPRGAAKLCDQLSETEKQALRNVEYQGIVCASALMKKPLAGYYVTNITDEGIPFTAVIEMTALVDREHFAGYTLIYLPKYVAEGHAVFAMSDEQIRETFLNALGRMYPALDQKDVVAFQVSRVGSVFAIPTLDYSRNLPSMSTSIPGLHLVNSSHIVNGTLNVNETIQLAENTVPSLLAGMNAGGRAAHAPA